MIGIAKVERYLPTSVGLAKFKCGSMNFEAVVLLGSCLSRAGDHDSISLPKC